MWLHLILCLSTALGYAQSCKAGLWLWDEPGTWIVSYNESPCVSSTPSFFCEDSGWGNKEATVVCREQGYLYGIGRYVRVEPYDHGYNHIECQGTEQALEECEVGEVTSQMCDHVAASQCSYVPQVYIDQISSTRALGYYLTIHEWMRNIKFCVVIDGPREEPLQIHVETTHANGNKYLPALADYDYIPSNFILVFTPSNMMRSRQCVQIEIIDDSLAEFWEVFTVLLSTNSSTVDLTLNKFDIYIFPNDGACFSSRETTDDNNSSLQRVEMCSSEGRCSPVCDYNWTLQDVTVACRELGYQDVTEPPLCSVLDAKESLQSGGVAYECQGNETRLADCMITLDTEEIPCFYALVKCVSTEDITGSTNDQGSGYHDHKNSPDSSGTSVGLVAGVVVSVVVALSVVTAMIVVALIVWLKKKTSSFKLAHRNGNSKRPLPPTLSSAAALTEESDVKPAISLANPTYQPNAIKPEPAAGTPEHKFVNPLYAAGVGAGLSEPTSSGGLAAPVIDDITYEYVETRFNGN